MVVETSVKRTTVMPSAPLSGSRVRDSELRSWTLMAGDETNTRS